MRKFEWWNCGMGCEYFCRGGKEYDGKQLENNWKMAMRQFANVLMCRLVHILLCRSIMGVAIS